MLEIKGLYKAKYNIKIKDIDLLVTAGGIASIECSIEMSNLLINLILDEEIPAKGEIYIDGQPNNDYLKKHLVNTGVVLVSEGYYERMTVDAYLSFYGELLKNGINYKDIMMKLGLLDIGDRKIAGLTYSQKRRVSLARERLKDITLLIFQEPIANIDGDSAKMIVENIEELRLMGTAVLCTSSSYKDALLIGGQVYLLDENGLEEIDHDNNIEFEAQNILTDTVASNLPTETPLYKVEKIPAKIDDTILLFNPIEIEYIESEQSISYLNIRGERFTCTFTLNELECRLEHLGFFRCHRSYLVNLQRVREMITWSRNSYSLILDDKKKSTIPLSKGRLDELKRTLNL